MRALVAVLVGVASLVISRPTSAEAEIVVPDALKVGVVTDITWGISRAQVDQTVAAVAASGSKWVRANVNWSGGEPTAKGVLNEAYLADMDYAVTKARAAGLEVLMPIADGVPYWASGDPNKYEEGWTQHWEKMWKPANFADYADFVRVVVNRYKALGVHTFELWNEPNLSRFWPSGVNAAEYKDMLAAAYPAAKLADPTATVLMGGLSKSDYFYMDELYEAGGAPFFDAVAIHPYTGGTDPTTCWGQNDGTGRLGIDAFCAIEEVRNSMVAHGDIAKPIWLTEFGWTSYDGPYGVTEAQQADYLTKAMDKLETYDFVKAAFWYNFRNTWDDPANSEANLGLVRHDFSQKPAYAALKAATATAPPSDTIAPVLSAVSASSITRTSAVVKWTSNEPASSRVEFWKAGTTKIRSVSSTQLVNLHSLKLSSLAKRTKYYYRVRSTDAAGNSSLSTTHSFTTAR